MDAPVPSPEALVGLATDDWSLVLAAALPVLRALPPEERDPVATRLVATPASRLVSGRPREQLVSVVRRPGVWTDVATRLGADVLARLGDPRSDEDGDDTALRGARARADEAERAAAAARDRAAALRTRLDELRRATGGASARVAAVERDLARVTDERDEARRTVDELKDLLAGAAAEQERSVERERRRLEGRVERDRVALRTARRAAEALREEVAALHRRLDDRAASSRRTPAVAPTVPHHDVGGGRRGRPSVLPAGLVPGSKDTASWLVSNGVPLLVDGYNVTRTHRPELGYERQRRWLEDAVVALARRRGVPSTIVWDSDVGPSTRRSRSGVTVRFTASPMSADDELVLHVQTLLEPDDPVVVVTDDTELRGRLGALGADLLDTTSFTWLLR